MRFYAALCNLTFFQVSTHLYKLFQNKFKNAIRNWTKWHSVWILDSSLFIFSLWTNLQYNTVSSVASYTDYQYILFVSKCKLKLAELESCSLILTVCQSLFSVSVSVSDSGSSVGLLFPRWDTLILIEVFGLRTKYFQKNAHSFVANEE